MEIGQFYDEELVAVDDAVYKSHHARRNAAINHVKDRVAESALIVKAIKSGEGESLWRVAFFCNHIRW